MYTAEKLILISVWIASFTSLWFIPSKKYREASFIFLAAQLPAWILGLSVVEADLIEYPFREFSETNSTSFSFEYLVLPLMCIFFNFHYPDNKNIYKKLFYIFCFFSIFTFIEYIAEKYTLILTYHNWEWYWTWLSMCVLFYFVRVLYKWFFKL